MRAADACALVALIVIAIGAWLYSDEVVALGAALLFLAGGLAVTEDGGRPRF